MTFTETAQRRAAIVAGFSILFTMAIVVYANYAIFERLFVAGDAAQTAHNILTHERLFRIGIVCDLAYGAGLVVLLSALYVILRPFGAGIALAAALMRLIYAIAWFTVTLALFNALRLIGDESYLRAFGGDRLQVLARASIGLAHDQYYAGLLFYGLASALCSVLWWKSNLVPKAVAAFGLVASVWCAFCTVAYLIDPRFANVVGLSWFDVPMVLFEFAVAFRLLFLGLRPVARPVRDVAGAAA